jgi:hypothetical protein
VTNSLLPVSLPTTTRLPSSIAPTFSWGKVAAVAVLFFAGIFYLAWKRHQKIQLDREIQEAHEIRVKKLDSFLAKVTAQLKITEGSYTSPEGQWAFRRVLQEITTYDGSGVFYTAKVDYSKENSPAIECTYNLYFTRLFNLEWFVKNGEKKGNRPTTVSSEEQTRILIPLLYVLCHELFSDPIFLEVAKGPDLMKQDSYSLRLLKTLALCYHGIRNRGVASEKDDKSITIAHFAFEENAYNALFFTERTPQYAMRLLFNELIEQITKFPGWEPSKLPPHYQNLFTPDTLPMPLG